MEPIEKFRTEAVVDCSRFSPKVEMRVVPEDEAQANFAAAQKEAKNRRLMQIEKQRRMQKSYAMAGRLGAWREAMDRLVFLNAFSDAERTPDMRQERQKLIDALRSTADIDARAEALKTEALNGDFKEVDPWHGTIREQGQWGTNVAFLPAAARKALNLAEGKPAGTIRPSRNTSLLTV